MTPEREQKLRAVIQKKQLDLTVVMENVDDPHNIAAVLRSCDAVGIKEVYVINEVPVNVKLSGKRSSSSANKWLDIQYYKNVKFCFEAVRKKYGTILGTHLGKQSSSLYDLDLTGSVALVFGNEKDGLSEEAISLCDGNFIIPQVGIIQSLNISVACAVSLYEAFRQRSLHGKYEHPISMEQENLIFGDWEQR